VPLRNEKAQRLVRAVLENVQDWESRALEIADAALPVTGNKARALSLARDMEQCRLSLTRLAAAALEDLSKPPPD
jgi:hypothetical protein